MGLEGLLRRVLRSQLGDIALAAVLRSSESSSARTSRLRVDLLDVVERLLKRARAAGAIREDIGAYDIRRLVCVIEHAVRVGGDDRDEIYRYTDVLLFGLRPER